MLKRILGELYEDLSAVDPPSPCHNWHLTEWVSIKQAIIDLEKIVEKAIRQTQRHCR